jgi:hypothetical protein
MAFTEHRINEKFKFMGFINESIEDLIVGFATVHVVAGMVYAIQKTYNVWQKFVNGHSNMVYNSMTMQEGVNCITFQSGKRFTFNGLPLQRKILTYYKKYVDISNYEMIRCNDVLKDIKKVIESGLQKEYPNIVRDLVDCGSCKEGLKVIHADEFDVMIPLYTNEQFYTQTIPGVPGFLVLRKKVRNQTITLLDEFLAYDNNDDPYLSPFKLRNKFQSLIHKAVKSLTKYSIESGLDGPSITLRVRYGLFFFKYFSVDFVPTVKMVGNNDIVAKPHAKYFKENNVYCYYEKFWRESYSTEEAHFFSRLPAESCEKICVKVVKAVRMNNKQLGIFHSYIFKTVMMAMIDDLTPTEWTNDKLQKRFVDFYKYFLHYLQQGNLPHYFNPDVNLMKDFTKEQIREVINYLQCIENNNSYEELLQQNLKCVLMISNVRHLLKSESSLCFNNFVFPQLY